jgi:nicotinate-nucleotide--dimethylbenzimidazole phosphoribosyltransferase
MNIAPVDEEWLRLAEKRQLRLTKPPGSLGRLEEIANRVAAIQQTETPAVRKPMIIVFAGDHGVCEEGVNPYPQVVTSQMVSNFLRGGAAINVLGYAAGADLMVVDVGVVHEIAFTSGLIDRKIARGTQNFCRLPAMTSAQASRGLSVGMEMVDRAVHQGSNLIGIGEMGIGNTTVASALTAVLTGLPPVAVVGRGTGADDACLERKITAVTKALALHNPSGLGAMDLVMNIGGFEIAAMMGACLRAAYHRCAVVVDGFIATVGAALAIRMQPDVRSYLFAAHRSTELGHDPLLTIIQQKPIFDLNMRLGEGTGAALAIPIIRAAADALSHMATFDSAGVSNTADTSK